MAILDHRLVADVTTMDNRPPAAPDRDVNAPVVILGCHRSGTSAVAGLLVAAGGLRIGSPLPPTAANPKGYFESAVVVKAHNDALARLDRDWTCPPARLPADPLSTELIRGEVQDLSAGDQPWGVKDPRLLFTLGLWCDVAPRMRFLGVVRDHEEVVRSLVARDGIRAGQADDITRAHIHRLRLLRDQVDFPIVGFSDGDFLESVRLAAQALGLAWDQDVAEEFYDRGLTHHRSDGLVDNPDVTHLLGLPPLDLAEAVDAPRVRQILDEVATVEEQSGDEITHLSLHTGVRAAWRRRQLWDKVPQDLHPNALELTCNDKLATSIPAAPEQAAVHEVRTMDEVMATLATTGPEAVAVVAGDFASWLYPDQLEAFIGLLAEHLPLETTVVLGVSEADRITATRLGREPIVFSDVVVALDDDFRLVDQGRVATLEWVRVTVRTSPTKQGQALASSRLEAARTQQIAEAARQEAEQAHTAMKAADERVRQADEATAREHKRADGLQQELWTARVRGDEAVAAAAADREEAERASAEAARMTVEATAWRDHYTRLRSSRTVATGLVIARAASPVVRAQRRVRRALGRIMGR